MTIFLIFPQPASITSYSYDHTSQKKQKKMICAQVRHTIPSFSCAQKYEDFLIFSLSVSISTRAQVQSGKPCEIQVKVIKIRFNTPTVYPLIYRSTNSASPNNCTQPTRNYVVNLTQVYGD